MIEFFLKIDSTPQARPRFNPYSRRAVDPQKSKDFKEALTYLVKSRFKRAPFTGELSVTVTIYRSAHKFKKGVSSHSYGDIDNHIKGIFDALNGVVWQDDSQITELHVKKALAAEPLIYIAVSNGNRQEAECQCIKKG